MITHSGDEAPTYWVGVVAISAFLVGEGSGCTYGLGKPEELEAVSRRKGDVATEESVTVQFFEVAGKQSSRVGPLIVGHYWIAQENELLVRGPFLTENEAVADFKRIGLRLLGVINKNAEYTLTGESSKERSPEALSPTSQARELASAQIDKLLDPAAPVEEGQQRKRRLLKGPKEFQDIRGDAPPKRKR